MSLNLNSKEFLARLLAVENLDVIHQNVQTASFNVKDRVLTLPNWDNMDSDTYDHLVGHEVGHALYTPSEQWTDEALENGPGFQTFMNVVEDARIEKLIQRKYPGLRRSFTKSYKKMLADGFFGGDVEKINTLKLIDRLNVYFKCGRTTGISFEEKELPWIDEINNLETFEQVVDIAKRLYEYEKQNQEKNKQEFGQNDKDDQDDSSMFDGQGFGDSDDGDETDEDSESDSSFGGDGDEDDSGEETDDDIDSTTSDGGSGDEIESETDKALAEKLKQEYSPASNVKVHNIFMNYDLNLNEYIIPADKVLSMVKSALGPEKEYGCPDQLYREFKKNNTKTINYLVKEFEMKKSAEIYSRAAISSTGVLDSIKMNSYRYNDDVFRKMTVLPQGKNHGMILFLDWSGSMTNNIRSTFDQLLNLVLFCRQVNIPFVVYAFTANRVWDKFQPSLKDQNKLMPQRGTKLFEMFSSKMNATKFSNMAKSLLLLADRIEKRGIYLDESIKMGSTPLDTTIMLATKIFDEFKKNNRVDIVNTIFLTDGESDGIGACMSIKDRYGPNISLDEDNKLDIFDVAMLKNQYTVVKIIDPISKKQYRIQEFRSELIRTEVTKILTQIYQEYTKSNAIGFRIISPNKKDFYEEIKRYVSDYEKISSMHEVLKKEKFVVIPNSGYKSYFALGGGRLLDVSNGSFEVADDASKRQIMSAYKKGSQSKQTSRVLLSKFIEIVA